MAWVQIQKAAQATWDDYEKIQQKIGDEAPEGLICHAAGKQDNGRWQAVSVWESEEHFNRFRDERLLQAVREVVPQFADAGPPPQETFEAEHVWPSGS